jgi:hypothetical protein
MEEILSLRQEMAQLLGFNNFAEYSLASKMAPDVETVHQFLVDLAEHARTPALAEIAELKSIAQQDGIEELKPWDATYYSEKLKQQQFNFLKKRLNRISLRQKWWMVYSRSYNVFMVFKSSNAKPLFGKMMYVILKLKIKVKWSVVSTLTYMPVTANAVAHG